MHRWFVPLAVMLALLAGPVLAGTLEDTRAMEQLASRHPKQAIEEATAALSKARASNDKAAQLQAYRQLAMSYDQQDDNAGLRDAATRGLALARELDDKAAQVELIGASAMTANNDGRHADAVHLHDQAIGLARNHGLDRELGKIYLSKAYALAGQEHTSEATELLLRAYEIFERLKERLHTATALSELGNLLTSEDASPEELQRAVDYHNRGMALLDPKANRYELSTAYYNLGVTYFYLKDYAASRQLMEKCLALGKELNDPSSPAYVSYRLARIEMMEKRPAKALPHFEAALPRFRATENAAMELMTLLGYADSMVQTGKRREGLATLAEAEALAKRLKSAKRDAQFYETSAAVHANLRDWEAAYKAMGSLREAERRVAAAARQRQAAELQARFNTAQRDSENRMLRLEQKADEARRLVLLMTLAFTILVALALVAHMVRQARQNRRVANLAMRDELTGLPNRRSILEFARMQFRGRRTGDRGLVLALLDLDHFKDINDKFGHSMGDEVLKAFAQACQSAMRSEDRLGRFGGEEFLLVMPGTDPAQISQVYTRLREAVSCARPDGTPLTFSMGATEARVVDPDLDSVIKRADAALYRAKEQGRDRHDVG